MGIVNADIEQAFILECLWVVIFVAILIIFNALTLESVEFQIYFVLFF